MRPREKGVALILSAALTLGLSSCTLTSFSAEGALTAPKLSEQQSQIHKALISSVGGGITFKYPRNGDNRSAYVIANIDDEPDNEALVFYQYTSMINGSEGIRLNLLDTDSEGNWYSVKELAGAGTDVDRVMISNEGGSSTANIVVGYQNIGINDKTLEIYRYKNGSFDRIGSDSYTLLEAADIDGDGYKNFITVKSSTDENGSPSGASASLLSLTNDEIAAQNTITMCDNTSDHVRSTVGRLEDNSYAVYVDGINTKGELQTELLFYRYGALQDPVAQRQSKLAPLTVRLPGYYCTDIDGDGVVEVPHTSVMKGYENIAPEDKLYRTDWSVYKDFYKFEQKYSGFYSLSDGYFFGFLSRWGDEVTVKKDALSGEYVFYRYTGDISSDMTELMRIAVSSKNDSGKLIDDGYELIAEKGQLDYLVKLPTVKREALIPTVDEVKNSFLIV
ncbi:MAG: hypothetical protein IKR76_12075 [Ruminococcus sp.]|nr:hypothetical protein [Ruminococcus sp.]